MKNYLLTAAVFAMMLTACTRNDDGRAVATDAGVPPAAPTPAAPDSGPPAGVAEASVPEQGDPVALGMLVAVNEHEIAAAKLAQEKKVSAAVLGFSKLMVAQHTENLQKTLDLGAPANTPEIQAMKDKSAQELQVLGSETGKNFERAYMDAMVSGHKEALMLIDTKMVPAASSDAVRAHLSDTRGHVEQHLQRAEQVDKALH